MAGVSENIGWICPRCGISNSPQMKTCDCADTGLPTDKSLAEGKVCVCAMDGRFGQCQMHPEKSLPATNKEAGMQSRAS